MTSFQRLIGQIVMRGSARRAALVIVALVGLGAASGVAEAGRRRVVVLDIDGPKGDKFQEDLVRLIKKTHTVVPVDKWNSAAEELGANGSSESALKKVAKKLKIDAIVEGRVEKRRDQYLLHLKVHEGKSGAVVGQPIDTKADGAHLDGSAQKDIQDELVGVIDTVSANRGGGGDDEGDDHPVGKPGKAGKKPAAEDEDEPRPAAKPGKAGKKPTAEDEDGDEPRRGFGKAGKKPAAADDDAVAAKPGKAGKKPAADEDEDKLPGKKPGKKPAAVDDDAVAAKPGKAGKKPATDEDEDKLPAKKPGKKPEETKLLATRAKPAADDDPPARPTKRVSAHTDEDAGEVEGKSTVAGAAALSPGERAIDVVAGLSVSMRTMAFTYRSDLLRDLRPPGYQGKPNPGAMLDATVYPLAISHDRHDMVKNLGLNLLYDRVLLIKSQDRNGIPYSTASARLGLAAVVRYPFGSSPTAPMVVGSLGYSSQSFSVTAGPGQKVDFPSVKYSAFTPGAGFRLPVGDKLVLAADVRMLLVLSAGEIQDPAQYGAASVLGFEGGASAEYAITPNIFARGGMRYETIGLKFKGTGAMTTMRDGDANTVDVTAARDNYLGFLATVGYLY